MAKKMSGPMSGLGMPDPIGSAPPAPEPDGDEMPTGGATLSPDTVGYHDDPRSCQNCSHNQNGNCEVIGQQVSPEGGCRVWEGGSDADSGMDDSAMQGGAMGGGMQSSGSGGYGS